MITLKKIDTYGQLTLILAFFILTLWLHNQVYLLGLLIVGAWQVLSVLIHLSSQKPNIEVPNRKYYRLFLVISILTLPIGSFWVLPLLAPFTAIWYLSISFRELRIWQHRHFIQLR